MLGAEITTAVAALVNQAAGGTLSAKSVHAVQAEARQKLTELSALARRGTAVATHHRPRDENKDRDENEAGPSAADSDKTAGSSPAEVYVARLHANDHLVLAQGARVGWMRATGDDWQVYAPDGRRVLVVTQAGVMAAVRAAAGALGVVGAKTATVTLGPLHDGRGEMIETAPAALGAWTLLRGRIAGRQDVVVRGRCVGWLQTDNQRRHVACTIAGPIAGSASSTRERAVLALVTALYAPVPLPDLPSEAYTKRRLRARPRGEHPISPYSVDQLAAAAFPDHLTRLADGSYRVHIDDGIEDIDLGRVHRYGRRWQASTPDGRRILVHKAKTRTEAVDRLLATPGPLFGDPADIVLHNV